MDILHQYLAYYTTPSLLFNKFFNNISRLGQTNAKIYIDGKFAGTGKNVSIVQGKGFKVKEKEWSKAHAGKCTSDIGTISELVEKKGENKNKAAMKILFFIKNLKYKYY